MRKIKRTMFFHNNSTDLMNSINNFIENNNISNVINIVERIDSFSNFVAVLFYFEPDEKIKDDYRD